MERAIWSLSIISQTYTAICSIGHINVIYTPINIQFQLVVSQSLDDQGSNYRIFDTSFHNKVVKQRNIIIYLFPHG